MVRWLHNREANDVAAAGLAMVPASLAVTGVSKYDGIGLGRSDFRGFHSGTIFLYYLSFLI